MARTYAYLFGLGATLLLVTLFLPHSSDRQVLPLLIAAALAYATAIGFLIGFERLPLGLFKAAPALGSTLISIVLYGAGADAISAYAVYFFWVTLSAAYFFSLRITFLQIAFATLLYALILRLRPEAELPMVHLVMMAGSLFVAGGLMVMLRGYAERAQGEGDRAKAEFIATISHELRTPLTSIIGYLDLLKDDGTRQISNEQRGEFTNVIDRNSRRLLRLVTDLLFIAQVQANGVQLSHADFDLAAVARESVETFGARAKHEEIDLRSEIEEVGICTGDGDRIGQVIDNLLSNAIKFTPPEGTVTVSLRRNGGGSAVLEVADTGIGIPESEHSQLFEDFYRASGAKRQFIEGTGLGLAIVRTIIEGHGGEVSFNSREGEGSTFRVSLPTERREATSSGLAHPHAAPTRRPRARVPRSLQARSGHSHRRSG
jgi:signal transduction histidine kinase